MLHKLMYLLKELSECRKRGKYLDGYYYAAGELLRGTPVVYFRDEMKIARDTLTHGLFDSGIEAAIYDWERKKCNCKSEENKMEKFVPDYGAPSEFVPLEECVHGGVYKLYCRNLAYGIFNQKDNGFIGIRTKFGNRYLFTEYHHDTGPPYGTVKPIEFVEQSPFEGDDVVGQFFGETYFQDNEEMRKYLDAIEDKYRLYYGEGED